MEITMHKSFKNLGLSSAALALVMAPAAVLAQDEAMAPITPEAATTATPPAETYPDAVEGADQGTMPESAPAQTLTPEEQEAAIATWPAETQAYYLSLDDERKKMFWALTDTDKVRLSQLPEDQREVAWGQIKAQIKSSQG